MSSLYSRLARGGIKRHRYLYRPFYVTFASLVCIYGLLFQLTAQQNLRQFYGVNQALALVELGIVVMTVFVPLLLLYADKYVWQSRSKEFGLYQVLGFTPAQTFRVLLSDTLMVAVPSIVVGLGIAAVGYPVVEQMFLRFLHVSDAAWSRPTVESLVVPVLLLGAMVVLMLLRRLWFVRKHSAKEVMEESKKREQGKWAQGILAVIALASWIGGYVVALTVGNPLKALQMFLLAVILVIIGTYAGFIALAPLGMKWLMCHKQSFYRKKHFIAWSNLRFRLFQNAKGLASVCVMSCGALVLLSLAAALFFSSDRVATGLFPRQVNLSWRENEVGSNTMEQLQMMTEGLRENEMSYVYALGYFDADGQTLVHANDPLFRADRVGVVFLDGHGHGPNGEDLPVGSYFSQQGEAWIEVRVGEFAIPLGEALGELPYHVMFTRHNPTNNVFVIVEDVEAVAAQGENPKLEVLGCYNFDLLEGSHLEGLSMPEGVQVNYQDANRQELAQLFGGVYFIGILLGLVFLAGTALVIYYKQVSEGLEDRGRYRTYRQVGMTEGEIRGAIRTQVRTIFLSAPLVAGIHMAVAFYPLTEMLRLIGLERDGSMVGAFVLVFAVYLGCYFIIYRLTSRTYYRLSSRL